MNVISTPPISPVYAFVYSRAYVGRFHAQQVNKCLAKAKSLKIDALKIYRDHGTELHWHRPNFDSMILDILEETEASNSNIVVIIHDPSRLSNDVTTFMELKKRIDSVSSIIFVTSIDSTSLPAR